METMLAEGISPVISCLPGSAGMSLAFNYGHSHLSLGSETGPAVWVMARPSGWQARSRLAWVTSTRGGPENLPGPVGRRNRDPPTSAPRRRVN